MHKKTEGKKRVLFIDRDGTLIAEAPPTYQLDHFDKLKFYPDVFWYMRRIATEMDYELVMVTNQDGLGTAAFPEETFWPVSYTHLDVYKRQRYWFRIMHSMQKSKRCSAS